MYLKISRSRVLPEKLTVPHPVKKHPTFYATWKFIAPFTSAGKLSLSSARSIQSMTLILFLENPF